MRLDGIGLLSPCGWGNLGDAAIQEAMIRSIRARRPQAVLLGLTLNPRDTTARHGIPAFPIAARALPGHWVATDDTRRLPAADGAPERPAPAVAGLRRTVKRIPLLPALVRAMRGMLAPVWEEARHTWQAYRLARGLEVIVVSGGGQLDEKWGGPWGAPWDLFKWSLVARLAGARFVVVSVGAEALDSRLSRYFIRAALARASYRSYRDDGSRARVEALLGFHGDPVVPDLAFGLGVSGILTPREKRAVAAVGVSPIAIGDARETSANAAAAHRTYLSTLAALVRWLVGLGHSVVLFPTATVDRRSIDDLMEELADLGQRISAPSVDSLDDLFAALSGVDLVVASRLHAAVLSAVAEKPVLAISYHAKVRTHMADLGLGAYCVDLRGAELGALQERFNALAADAQRLVPDIRRRLKEYHILLEAQYDRLFGPEAAA